MKDFKKACQKVLLSNRRTVKGHQYTLPSPDTYPYQWLWDSCFHAIILTHFSLADAKKEILSLLSEQFENGLIPHMIYWDKTSSNNFPAIEWGKEDTSSITQPPMIAYAVWEIFKKDQDKNFLEKVYPNLYHFYRYLLTERDPHENHLIGIMNPDESGEDNSPRFDIPLSLPSQHNIKENSKKRLELVAQNIECNFDAPFCMRNFFWVKDVPYNAIMIENLKLLSKIAQALGHSKDADFFFNEQEKIGQAMKERMLERNLYWSTCGKDYRRIKVKTWAIFAPLFAGILTQKQANKLVEKHLLNTAEFKTSFLLPTVSIDEPSFNPTGFWRGPVWIATNWFVYKGLMKYGFVDAAEEIKKSSLSLVAKSGFREYFNPFTGEGLGAKNFTWGCLILDMVTTN